MKVCAHCGVKENEHCIPVWVEFPDSCVCDPMEWFPEEDKIITPVCSEFKGEHGKPCHNCEHDFGCHTKTTNKA
jgi:hypothetical protein